MRWRYPLFVLILALIFIALFSFFAHSEEPTTIATVTVRSGDTLWSLAREHGDPNSDPRNTVYVIRQINDLDSPQIYPGQKLQVPVRN